MSEQNSNLNPLSAQEELMRRLKSIGVDLWGGGTPEETARAEEAVEQDFAAAATPGNAEAVPAEGMQSRDKKKAAEKPKIGIENLWITADETIDWTDALLHDTPRDGLTGQRLWSFYHRIAESVLAGKTEAYAEVLTTINPLGDLTEYVAGMILRTPSSDRLECVFECQRDDLEKYGRDYLGSLSLRIARDLLAALPVEEVHIIGNLEGKEKVNVTFRRSQLLKKKMAFLNPADFTEECGGIISA